MKLNRIHREVLWFMAFVIMTFTANAQSKTSVKIALLKYGGGGDWYANPTSLGDLIQYCNKNIGTNIDPEPATVDVGSPEIFNYPFLDMTGHGNVFFTDAEVKNLRKYLESGGFLHADDNYGLDKYIRREMKKVFPESELVELPFTHPIYHQKYDFPNGLPKIHEHDGKPPQGFGIFYKGRLVFFYTYECDLGDGWENPAVHHDPWTLREKALQMGANIISYVFDHP
jgi:hypothetical protein